MEAVFTVTADFDAVYLINGAFVETPVFRFDPHDVLYVTVLPLESHLLPYTVKIVLGCAQNNADLAVCARLGEDYYIRFLPRYAYAYDAHKKPDLPTGSSVPCRFFELVKAGNLIPARAMMTDELSKSVTDDDLSAFFDGYTALLENAGRFYLLDENRVGVPFRFTLTDGRIDNIEEDG